MCGWCQQWLYPAVKWFIHAYHYGSNIFVPENHKNQNGIPEIWIASQKFQILSFMKQQQQANTVFPIFPESSFRFAPRVAEVFVPELTEATFWRVAHAWKIEICRFDLGSALRIRKGHKAKKSFSEVSWGEHCIREAASQIDLQNQCAICKNVSCLRESMAESIDRAPAELFPAKRRCFQTFKKAYHEKAFRHSWWGRWHLRELWSSQYSCEMIELADSRGWSANSVFSCAESVREVHSILFINFPVKSGSWIYFINVGMHLLMCSGKLCCVPDFGDFCSWKRNFGVGMYE